MKPKVSTGYFTPQSKKQKNTRRNTLSAGKLDDAEEFDENLFRDFMRCPQNKNAVLELLSANKEVIKKYTEKHAKDSVASSVDKPKKKNKGKCEGPIALMRRRGLEQMNGSPSSSNRSDNLKNPSERSENSSNDPSPIPFEKVLDGVIAYVEVKGPLDEDRSGGVKSVLKSMGCQVREKFTRDVTHVIFKDASYTTFKRAEVMKVHLVSILWVESCRKTKQRQIEKYFPAMNSGYGNESIICSQMQKEYEDIIRDEYRRNMMQGAVLPTTESFINRRRTLMTLSVSHEMANAKVSTTNAFQFNQNLGTEGMINNDLDKTCNTPWQKPLNWSDMELTNITNEPFNGHNDIFQNRKIPGKSKLSLEFNKRKTICNSLLTSDSSSRDLISSDKSSDISGVSVLINSKRGSKGSSMDLESDESFIYGKNTAVEQKKPLDSGTEMSELKLSTQLNCSKTTPAKLSSNLSTSMSNLRLSLSSRRCSTSKLIAERALVGRNSNSSSSAMSSLKLHSDKEIDDMQKSSVALKSLTQNRLLAASMAVNSEEKKNGPRKSSLDPSKDRKASSKKHKLDALNVDCQREANSLSKSSIASAETTEKIKTKPLTPGVNYARRFSLRNCNSRTHSATDFTSFCNSNDSTKNAIIEPEEHPGQADLTSSADSSLSDDSEIIVDKNTSNTRTGFKVLFKSSTPVLTDRDQNVSETPSCVQGSKSKRKSRKSKSAVHVTLKRGVGAKSNTISAEGLKNLADEPKKTRKLYNPDKYVVQLDKSVDDEAERQQKRNQLRKRKPDETDNINPFALLVENNKEAERTTSESDASPPKSTRKNTRQIKDVTLSTSADEQKDLLAYVLRSETKTPKSQKSKGTLADTPTPRRSTRIRHVKKPFEVPITPRNRRSTLDFMPVSQRSCKKPKKKIDKTKLPTIVCTKLHRTQVEVFAQIVKKLGKFVIEDEVSERTTHMIAGEPKRTINMLRAISRGCWVLKFEWVLQSLGEGRWLPEENFEVMDFSPTVQKARLERQAFGSKYTLDVFENCPPIYVALSTTPRCSDLRELITTCKGRLVTTPRVARIIVGLYVKQDDTVCVNENWVLDSIMYYKKMPFRERYLLAARENRNSLVV